MLTGIAIGFAGVALLIWPGIGAATTTPLLPQIVIMMACIGWSVATIYLRNINTRLDVISLTALQMLIGGLLLLLAGLAWGESGAWHWSTPGMLSLAWLTIFSACCAYTAYAWLAQNATPAQVGTYSYVNPAIATLLGYLLLDEVLSPVQLIGTGVILAGVILVNWPTTESRVAPKKA